MSVKSKPATSQSKARRSRKSPIESACKIIFRNKMFPSEIFGVDEKGKVLCRYVMVPTGMKCATPSSVDAITSGTLAETAAPTTAKTETARSGLLPPIDPERRAKTLEAARVRGIIIADDIMTRADMATGEELAVEFNMTRQAIDRRFRKGQLLGLSTAKRGRRYPTAQFDHNGRLLPGIVEVLRHFQGEGWRAWRFLSTEHVELENRTAFTALRDKRVGEVIALLTAIDNGAFS